MKKNNLAAYPCPGLARNQNDIFLISICFITLICLLNKNVEIFQHLQNNSFSQNYEYFVGEGNGNPLQYSCLENPMDGGSWQATVHGVMKSQTPLSNFTFTFHFNALKEMATHSSILAWRIPGTEKPGGLPSMGSHRVGHY